MKILVTGCAGFIGYHLTKKLLANNFEVIGLDNLNCYYDNNLKKSRLAELGIKPEHLKQNNAAQNGAFTFYYGSLENNEILKTVFDHQIDIVCNLAAEVGVRNSILNPQDYITTNIVGFYNLIEQAKQANIKTFIYASSSSVYGNNETLPFTENQNTDNPISLYAASKKSNELIAHTYSHLHDMKTIGLRFFTVYGPFGRPDMASFSFVKKVLNNEPIQLFNNGNLERDFTFVDDIVAGIFAIINTNGSGTKSNYEIYNIGNNEPVTLARFVKAIETALDKKAVIELLPMQPGDALKTYASVSKLSTDYGFAPSTNIETGMQKFVDWYKNYYL